ncbi:MAG: hypothetical protein AAF743_17060, partial [Planctomycetota bacterium]
MSTTHPDVPARCPAPAAVCESLEQRRLLSTTLVEAEAGSGVLRNDAGEIVRLPGSAIGVAGVSTVAVNLPLNNVFKHNNTWISGPKAGGAWDDQRPIELDANGYPVALLDDQVARSVLFQDDGGHHPIGQYVVEWDGTGDIEVRGQYVFEWETAPGVTDNRKVFIHSEPGNIYINLLETDPADPVRNIRVWLPGREDSASYFTDEFKANLEPFPVLRFMDWNRTNGSTHVDWSDRTDLDDAHWGWSAGVPYELMIQLGNELGKDVWLNVPHAANDDYVTQLARLVRDNLNPELDVWIEYSNETWNTAGPFRAQYDHVQMLADQWDVSHDTAHGMRSGQIFDIFEAELGGTDGLVRVVAGQAFNPGGLQIRVNGAGPENVDTGAIAYYFTRSATGRYINDNADDLDYDEVFDRIAQDT